PVERITLVDVPGLVFWVETPEDRPGWRITAGLTIHPRRREPDGLQRFVDYVTLTTPKVEDLPPNPARRWSAERHFPDRPGLVAGFSGAAAEVVEVLRDAAGPLWPRRQR
ncbi:MAG: hypothetical protein JWO38_7007, partial [Gemmataceae bacterium]|nr:hypothetical protein [Gemmataceae bacterium]